uniref:histidine kinase n=1 Tax=Solibacter usitatus (strain Ellin6076) TaxID=234267 RepID=Q02BM7_SOLUE
MTFDQPSRTDQSDEAATIPILTVSILEESDVVAARQRARQIAAEIGFDVHQQTRLATAVSEIARNAYNYGGGGRVEFSIEGTTVPQLFVIRVADAGRGIPDLQSILDGRYQSETGMGLGISRARRLMDRFEIESPPGGGVTVTMTRMLPLRAPLVTRLTLVKLLDRLAAQAPPAALQELQQQNRELLATLEELAVRQEELVRLNLELEDTNRGVVALYAELDDKADHLRRADEMKSRFLSNMSHEFRTPLNSILALTRLLLDRAEGDLTGEQERQVFFIRKSAESLYELVNDLLDLAKVQAGKTTVHLAPFDVKNLFGALRGMLRPLLVNTAVNLVFEEPEGISEVVSDEGKISQILRNFISNALKFTDHGEVRVFVRREDADRVIFSVSDTGIGIDPADADRVFEEFTQLESPIQRKVKGTGLGLPLSRKLAELLGGTVSVESSPGVGSTFSLTIPIGDAVSAAAPAGESASEIAGKLPVLVVEDEPETRMIYVDYLKGSQYYVMQAATLNQARAAIERVRPSAILLDLMLSNEDGCALLAELKGGKDTKDIPVLVITVVDDPHKVYGLGADVYAVKPVSKKWLLDALDKATGPPGAARRVLLVDDDPTFRYLARQIFAGMPHEFTEADTGVAGLEAARATHPELIFLDLMMPKMSGYEVLEHLRADPKTRDIPVVVVSSRFLNPAEQRQLRDLNAAILPKDDFARADLLSNVREILTTFGLANLLPT